jgi:CyaY protein
MTENEYLALADRTFRRIEDMFEDVDADDVDVERAGDVVTLVFKNGGKCIVNTQRPTRQIWLAVAGSAAGGTAQAPNAARAWHFDWDGARWVDAKDDTVELLGAIARIAEEQAGVRVALR